METWNDFLTSLLEVWDNLWPFLLTLPLLLALIFAICILRRRWHTEEPKRPIRNLVIGFIGCMLLWSLIFVGLAMDVVPAPPTKYFYYRHFINGTQVGQSAVMSDGGTVEGNIKAATFLAPPLFSGCIFLIAFCIVAVMELYNPKGRKYPLNKFHFIWGVVNLPAALLGVIPIILTLRASKAENEQFHHRLLRRAKIANSIIFVCFWVIAFRRIIQLAI